jgi:hypothetical protein
MTTQICLFSVGLCLCPGGIEVASATEREARAAVFRAAGFPTVDAPAIDDTTLATALAGLSSQTFDSPADLASGL